MYGAEIIVIIILQDIQILFICISFITLYIWNKYVNYACMHAKSLSVQFSSVTLVVSNSLQPYGL